MVPSLAAPADSLTKTLFQAAQLNTQVPARQVRTYERAMGDTELSYYLPSRADGANDMSIFLGFRGPRCLFTPRRILTTWAILLLRHPPISARVIPPPSNGSPSDTDYTNVKLSYAAPTSPADALRKASSQLEIRKNVTGYELIDRHINGKRLLSDSRLVHLTFSENSSDLENEHAEYVFFVTSAHYISDGLGTRLLANEFFTLIAGTEMGYGWSEIELENQLRKEWQVRWGAAATGSANVLPPPVEDRLPPIGGKLKTVVGKIDFINATRAQIGGHVLPRTKGAPRKGVVQTVVFDEFKSKIILKTCKSRGVSLSNALFSLSALAWSRTQRRRGVEIRGDLPIMMYSALNLRPYLLPSDCTYWNVALGFFNVVLPSFIPSSAQPDQIDSWKPLQKIHWHRARSARAQSSRAAKHTMLVSRAREMARQRRATAVAFAAEDDAKALGVPLPPPPPITKSAFASSAPSAALFGLSHLGNADSIYQRQNYPSIQLHTYQPATRIRPGGVMTFVCTFAGKVRLTLVHDANGFEDNAVDMWWGDLLRGVEELLVGTPTARL